MPYSKAHYDKLKEAHICVRCGKNPTNGKRTLCDSCSKKAKDYAYRNREKRILYAREYRIGLREANLCVRCGKAKAVPGLCQCEECQKRSAARKHEYTTKAYIEHRELMKERYHARKEQGICVICGRNKAAPGKVKCQACTQRINLGRRGYVEHRWEWYVKERKEGRLK